jgi:hypothetical protein
LTSSFGDGSAAAVTGAAFGGFVVAPPGVGNSDASNSSVRLRRDTAARNMTSNLRRGNRLLSWFDDPRSRRHFRDARNGV